MPWLVFEVSLVVRDGQRQLPHRSPTVSLEITFGFRSEKGGPDVLAGVLEILLAVRARTPSLDRGTLSEKLHIVRLASPDGRVHEPRIALMTVTLRETK